jgi:hypothetical protein
MNKVRDISKLATQGHIRRFIDSYLFNRPPERELADLQELKIAFNQIIDSDIQVAMYRTRRIQRLGR